MAPHCCDVGRQQIEQRFHLHQPSGVANAISEFRYYCPTPTPFTAGFIFHFAHDTWGVSVSDAVQLYQYDILRYKEVYTSIGSPFRFKTSPFGLASWVMCSRRDSVSFCCGASRTTGTRRTCETINVRSETWFVVRMYYDMYVYIRCSLHSPPCFCVLYGHAQHTTETTKHCGSKTRRLSRWQ